MTGKEKINTGRWSLEDLEKMIGAAAAITGCGERISYLSRQFLGIQYKGNTLAGDVDTEELFTVNLEEMDCSTFIDYVAAMSLSDSFSSFRANLKRVRYQNGIVSFVRRNHFFTDWAAYNPGLFEDVTAEIAPGRTRKIAKQLNVKEDGLPFVPGVRPVRRDICYIPSQAMDEAVVDRLESGDYIGIYSGMKGLDVSHVGVYIREGDNIIFRHASSRTENMKVLDEAFMPYASSKPGIICLRQKG
jgi:hypothetical protein